MKINRPQLQTKSIQKSENLEMPDLEVPFTSKETITSKRQGYQSLLPKLKESHKPTNDKVVILLLFTKKKSYLLFLFHCK